MSVLIAAGFSVPSFMHFMWACCDIQTNTRTALVVGVMTRERRQRELLRPHSWCSQRVMAIMSEDWGNVENSEGTRRRREEGWEAGFIHAISPNHTNAGHHSFSLSLLVFSFLSSSSCLHRSCRKLFVKASLHLYLLALGEARPLRNRHSILQIVWHEESLMQEERSSEHSAPLIQRVAHRKMMTSQ
jgi:hypothetical protein